MLSGGDGTDPVSILSKNKSFVVIWSARLSTSEALSWSSVQSVVGYCQLSGYFLHRGITAVNYLPELEVVVSRFTETIFGNAQTSINGMVTGEPHAPLRHTWIEVHEQARRIAGGLAFAGVWHGDRVCVLAGAPVEIAPTAQGLWMRGASLTMLHQPTARIDLKVWADGAAGVIDMIEGKLVIVSDPFMAAAPVLAERGVTVVTVAELLGAVPVDPAHSGEHDLALLQLTSGSTGSPKAVAITHGNIVANAEAMFGAAEYDISADVIVSWLPLFHDMGMTGFLTVPMYFGAELVKVTPMDFLRDILLWPKLIDKYRGTMTAAPNFAYSLLAKRLRNHASPVNSTCPPCDGHYRAPSRSSPPTSSERPAESRAFGQAVPSRCGWPRDAPANHSPLP
jgi:acyl-CoA synthetase (AMP-forming)/AMP-acid ligase II